MNELIKRLENLQSEISNLKSHLNLPQKEQRILELEERMQGSDFWADNENAQKVIAGIQSVKKVFTIFGRDWKTRLRRTWSWLSIIRMKRKKRKKYLENVAGLEAEYRKNRFFALLNKKVRRPQRDFFPAQRRRGSGRTGLGGNALADVFALLRKQGFYH